MKTGGELRLVYPGRGCHAGMWGAARQERLLCLEKFLHCSTWGCLRALGGEGSTMSNAQGRWSQACWPNVPPKLLYLDTTSKWFHFPVWKQTPWSWAAGCWHSPCSTHSSPSSSPFPPRGHPNPAWDWGTAQPHHSLLNCNQISLEMSAEIFINIIASSCWCQTGNFKLNKLFHVSKWGK